MGGLFAFPLAFSAPLMLAALAALPVIWWLLRVTPPRPRRIDFPPLKIALDLIPKQENPSKTPWWLLALRLAIAGLVILAVAGPVMAPQQQTSVPKTGPLVLLIDNGFAAARDWPERVALAEARIGVAARQGRGAAIAGLAEAPAEITIGTPASALEKLRALSLRPHAPDRALHLPVLNAALERYASAELAWISDGTTLADAAPFMQRLSEIGKNGRLSIHADIPAGLVLAGADHQSSALSVKVQRAVASGGTAGLVRAYDAKGLALGESPFSFAGTAMVATARFQMPIELRNAVSRLEIDGERSAGAVTLMDERSRRRRVGVISSITADMAQPLLSPTYYVTRALAPFAELREAAAGATDPVGALLAQNLSVLVLADVGALDRDATDKITAFVDHGGMLLRFAGPRLAAGSDNLSPVRLRRGGRSLGGALSWEAPRKLAPFIRTSPFDGLTTPDEVKITRQILAEPDADLPGKVWAALDDGTPVVTAERRGQGLIVLFHVTADTTWSNLPLSGLFVEMLRKTVAMAGAPAENAIGEARIERVAAQRVLDGYGVLRSPPPTAQPVQRGTTAHATLIHPPGFYGAAENLTAVNAVSENDAYTALKLETLSAPVTAIARSVARDLRPPLLTLALLLLALDAFLTLWLSGQLRMKKNMLTKTSSVASLLMASAVFLATAFPINAAFAQNMPATSALPPVTQQVVDAAKATRLAYIITGDRAVDETSRAGLTGLTQALAVRTALEPGEPVALDAMRDELALFPLIYWPVVAGRPTPAPETLRKLDAFMKGGGMVIFDTRDALVARPGGGPSPEAQALRQMLTTLDVPELEPVPRDHVLTKTFYLLDSFPGRHSTGQLWLETLPPVAEDGKRPARAGDSVSPLMITSNDLASAWAVGRRGEALYPMSGSDPRQREMALRGGVNIVMYALTGNYKADQVHVPALLERLGQ